jgi:DNA-binding NtrC family response regulator
VGTTRVDVRVVAATNRELRRETSAGQFRLDLYYRLAVIRIRMPALRERPDDIPAIARRLLHDLGASDRNIDALLGREVLDELSRADWPGNVRELKNFLERCLAMGGVVPLEPVEQMGCPDIGLPFGEARRVAIDEFERAYLARILAAHGHQVSAAAVAAGIDRTHFHRLIRRHRLR